MQKHLFAPAFEILSNHPDPHVRCITEASGVPRQEIPGSPSLDAAVLRIVIAQLLSSKAAATINRQLLETFGGIEGVFEMLPGLDASRPAHRLSAAKIRSLQSWIGSARRREGVPPGIRYPELQVLFRDIKGFGPWSVDMLAIFQLALPDVWPLGDLVVRSTALRFWADGNPPVERNLRTALALCCWQAKHNGF